MPELKVVATGSREICSIYPNNGFKTDAEVTIEEGKSILTNVAFEFPYPKALEYKAIRQIRLGVYVTSLTNTYQNDTIAAQVATFNEKSLEYITWNDGYSERVDVSDYIATTEIPPLYVNQYYTPKPKDLKVSLSRFLPIPGKARLLCMVDSMAHEFSKVASISFYTDKSTSNKPWAIYIYENPTFTVTPISPKDGVTVNFKEKIRIVLDVRSNETYTGSSAPRQITNIRVVWRRAGTAEKNYTTIAVSGAKIDVIDYNVLYSLLGCRIEADIPVNIIPTGYNIDWFAQIQIKGLSYWQGTGLEGNGQQDFVAGGYATFSTIDSISSAQLISPVNVYLSTGDVNRFEWRHIIATGTSPTKSELQYSRDGSTWQPLATVNGSATTTTIPAHTLYGGTNYWRVRTYNNDGAAGNWSDPASFVVRGAPAPPKIASVTNTPRPIVRWQAADQSGYQVQILDKAGNVVDDSGEVYGTLKAYAASDYLAYGSYIVRVRIKSGSGMWSAWVNGSAEVPPITITAPIVSYIPHDGYVEIRVSNASSFAKLYLIRDGVPIAKIASTYKDYTAGPSQTYFVRGVNTSDLYADSGPEVVRCPIEQGATLALIGNPAIMFRLLIRRGELPKLTGQTNYSSTANNYAGREYPVYSISEHKAKSFELAFSLRDRQDWVRLCQLIDSRQTMIYRDVLGNKEYGVVLAASHSQDRISTDFTLTFDRCDYVEKINYDLPPGV